MSPRLDELLERFQAGEATAAELSELESLLRNQASNRRRLVIALLLDVHLHKAFAGIVPSAAVGATPNRTWRRVATWAVAAAILLTLGSLASTYFWPESAPTSHLDSGHVRVAGASSVVDVPEGKYFEVTGDVPAVLRLSDGSRAAFEPRTQGIVHGKQGAARQVVEMTEGAGTFNVQKSQNQFRVDTPAGSVTALGTEFTVKLRPAAKKKEETKNRLTMAVSVAEGSVRVNANGQDQVLTAGKNRVFGDDGDQNNRDDGQQNNQNQGKQGMQGNNQQ
jgi:ferric-dicitrate binding protein FerR (iron transport regulator)